MLHFGKIPKKFGKNWRKFNSVKILAKFAKILGEKQQKIQHFLTKILRLESDAKAVDSKAMQRSARSPSSPAGVDGSAVLQAGELPSSGVT